MKQYIEKSALVAEIERHLEYANNGIEYAQMGIDRGIEHCKVELAVWQYCQNMCKQILSFLDILEVKEYSEEYDGFLSKELKMVDDEIERLEKLKVKEVDLEKEYEEFVVDDPILRNFITNDTMGIEFAKHFFELGMLVSNKARKGE